MSVCTKFSQLCFCQISFELVYSWESYITKIKKGELFIETQCRYFNTDREFGYLNLQCKTNFRGLRLAAFESPLTSAGKTVNNHLCIDSPGGAFHIILYLNR